MKAFGTVLIVLGIVALILSVYGFVQNQDEMEIASALIKGFGLTSEMDFGSQLQLFAFDNRVVLLIAGLLASIGGGLLRKKG